MVTKTSSRWDRGILAQEFSSVGMMVEDHISATRKDIIIFH